MGLSQYNEKKAGEGSAVEEEVFLAEESDGEDAESGEGP